MALMKSEEALVNNVGIKRFGYYYMDDELLPYINQKIHIKVDPYDVTSIYCINNKGGLICQAQLPGAGSSSARYRTRHCRSIGRCRGGS